MVPNHFPIEMILQVDHHPPSGAWDGLGGWGELFVVDDYWYVWYLLLSHMMIIIIVIMIMMMVMLVMMVSRRMVAVIAVTWWYDDMIILEGKSWMFSFDHQRFHAPVYWGILPGSRGFASQILNRISICQQWDVRPYCQYCHRMFRNIGWSKIQNAFLTLFYLCVAVKAYSNHNIIYLCVGWCKSMFFYVSYEVSHSCSIHTSIYI